MDDIFCVRGNLDIVKCMQNNDDKYYIRILVLTVFSGVQVELVYKSTLLF